MGKRILIVDDSSMMRRMIEKLLTESGHTIVGEAKNGAEAVALYKDLNPDLVTMDITMREMDGFTAAREILKFDDAAQIIFLSNLDREKYGDDAEQLGAVGYVSKRKSTQILDLIESA
jgi:two-component system chemotaxis response regulator CheY